VFKDHHHTSDEPPSDAEILDDMFSLGGFVTNPNTYNDHIPQLKSRGLKEGWSRFIMFVTLHDKAEVRVRVGVRHHVCNPTRQS